MVKYILSKVLSWDILAEDSNKTVNLNLTHATILGATAGVVINGMLRVVNWGAEVVGKTV
jgi:hypothetical protein